MVSNVAQLRPPPPPTSSGNSPAPIRREEFTYDTINERVLIGAAVAMQTAERAVLVRSVAPDELLLPEHVIIWRALRVMVDQGLEYNPTVMRRLVQDEGGRVESEYLSELETTAEVPSNLEWHLKTLRWDSTRASVLQNVLPDLIRALKDPKAEPAKAVSMAQALIRSLDDRGFGKEYIRRKDELARSYKAEIAARVAVGNFYPFGFQAMDLRLSEGAMPKRTALVAGVSGSGKSTWTASLALALADVERGRRVLYGCWEMPSESMLDVMVASMTRIPLEKIIQGRLSTEEKARVDKATDRICSRITFMDNPFFEKRKGRKRSNEENQDLLESYIAKSNCDVVIMDLWERMLVDLKPDAVTEALARQQQMHKDYNVYGVICHQINLKDVGARSNKRPTPDVLKGVGMYYEMPDQVFAIYREAMYKAVPDESLECICMKQRKGRGLWAVRFKWNGEFALVSGGEEISYDPGLESSTDFSGGIGDIKSGHRKRPARREG